MIETCRLKNDVIFMQTYSNDVTLSKCNNLSKITYLKWYQLNEIVNLKAAVEKNDYQKVPTCKKKIQSHLEIVYCVDLFVY